MTRVLLDHGDQCLSGIVTGGRQAHDATVVATSGPSAGQVESQVVEDHYR